MTSDMATTKIIEGKTVKTKFIGSFINDIKPVIQTIDVETISSGIQIPHQDLNAIHKKTITKIKDKPIKKMVSNCITSI